MENIKTDVEIRRELIALDPRYKEMLHDWLKVLTFRVECINPTTSIVGENEVLFCTPVEQTRLWFADISHLPIVENLNKLIENMPDKVLESIFFNTIKIEEKTNKFDQFVYSLNSDRLKSQYKHIVYKLSSYVINDYTDSNRGCEIRVPNPYFSEEAL